MLFADMVSRLNDDLKNEWKHLRFYLYHASAITGLHAHEYKELFLEQAASEMQHVSQFSDLIIGLGGVPTAESHDFPKLTTAGAAIGYAAIMEAEVVKNYTQRIAQLDSILNDAAGDIAAHKKWLEIFLEKQIEDSRKDLDHFKQLLNGV